MSFYQKSNKELYFIGLTPPERISAQVTALKDEMANRFKARHALKSPPHITLQMPFRLLPDGETRLIQLLQFWAGKNQVFNVSLDGFDHFESRVIFIRIVDHEPIRVLHSNLVAELMRDFFSEIKTSKRFHPHMTIATRDLTTHAFYRAWSEFKERRFNESFIAQSVVLFKHNGSHWESFQVFQLNTPE